MVQQLGAHVDFAEDKSCLPALTKGGSKPYVTLAPWLLQTLLASKDTCNAPDTHTYMPALTYTNTINP